MTNFIKRLEQPLQEDEWPFLVITCGDNHSQDPHGRIEVARFFDSRFEDSAAFGRSMPRFDLPNLTPSDVFNWDCYRLDIGPTGLKKLPNGETLATTGYKSGERLFDSLKRIQIGCQGQVPTETRGGKIVDKPCSEKTNISREDWREVGKLLVTHGLVKKGERYSFVDRKFLASLVKGIQTTRNKEPDRERSL